MKTTRGNLQKIRGIPIKKRDEGNVMRNACVYPNNTSLHLLHTQFHQSLDINQPVQVKWHDGYKFFAGLGDNFKGEPTSKGIKKRSRINSKMKEHGRCLSIDLELRLSPPGSSSDSFPNVVKSASSWTPLPSSSQGSYLSSILDSDLGGTAKSGLPKLIATGCTRCRIYVMVSGANTRCPQCKNHSLLLISFK